MIVRQEDIGKLDHRYVVDQESGALKQIIQRVPLKNGTIDETRTDVKRWEVLADSPALRQRLSTLDPTGIGRTEGLTLLLGVVAIVGP